MAFSFPSLDQVAERILFLFKRFPFVALVSFLGTVVAVWYAGLDYEDQELYPNAVKLIFICILGISLLFSLATFLEQVEWKAYWKLGVNILGIILLVAYYFLLGDRWEEGPAEVWYRYALFFLASHLFVAFAPFLSKGKLDSFWEYNKALFLRVLLSVLYSGVLFAGLSIALLSIDNLLGLDVKDERYLQLFFFLGGIFNTWFFLAGIPDKETITHEQLVFPKGLRIFVQFVLIPLVSVYIFILYLYLIKIIVEWQLPNGWVANLVLSFSIAGILSLLLLFPIRESSEHKWIRWYSKGYYIALIPLIGLLMLSIGVRISEYGVTINRYYVATLGVWLTGMVFYFILSKAKSIKVIPISLCAIALLTSFGPLGAFAVSERSQTGRFEEILSMNDMLDEQGMVIPKKEGLEVSFDDRKQLGSSIGYLLENHGMERLQQYFKTDLSSIIDSTFADQEFNYMGPEEKIISFIGLKYVEEWEDTEDEEVTIEYFDYSLIPFYPVEIKDYDYAVNSGLLLKEKEKEFEIEGELWSVQLKEESKELSFAKKNTGETFVVSYEQIQKGLLDSYPKETNNVAFEDMSIIAGNEEIEVLIVFINLSGITGDNEILQVLNLNLYVKTK